MTTKIIDTDFGKLRFGWLLKQRCYQYVDEDHLGERIEVQSTRPDYYVETPDGTEFLVEVESFDKGHELDMRPGFRQVGNYDAVLGRIRTAIKHAAKQLRAYQKLGMPLLIVLDNYRNVPLLVGDSHMSEALFGRVVFAFKVLSTGARFLDEPSSYHGKGQVFNDREKRYISAVALNLRKAKYTYNTTDSEVLMRLRVFHNPFASKPLPLSLFCDEEDTHLGYAGPGVWTHLGRTEAPADQGKSLQEA
jgi:hypothetical protein